jgi:dTDP-D-glucose 4,6-dehydratase
MVKNIFITGGAGFIGHQVIKEILESTDWKLFVVDRLSYAGDLIKYRYLFCNYYPYLIFK